PIGHSLGQILYSCPLAPGESVNLAVIDWTHRDSALRNENTKLDESLVHELRRDRTITETVRASIDEWQRGGSVMGGMATSVGGALGASGMGVAGGAANSIGGAYSTSRGSREIAGDTVQKLSDNVAQASASSRELNSTIVVQNAQSEKEVIETRTIVNYNHSHALTILYYEVLRHFRVVSEFVRRRPAVLTNIHGGITTQMNVGGVNRAVINTPVILENRKVIEAALLDPRYREQLDMMERARHRQRVSDVINLPPPSPPSPPPPQGPEFRYFTFEMRTGGLVAEGSDEDVWINVNIDLNSPPGFIPLNKGERISLPGAFFQKEVTNWFTSRTEPPAPRTISWGQIEAVMIRVNLANGGDSDTDVSFSFIKVTGTDTNGNETVLFEKAYADGDLKIDNDAWVMLPTRRPAPLPPPPGRPAAEIEEEAKIKAFTDHLLYHRAHYERALRLGAEPAQRAAELAALAVGSGSLLEKVDNRPLEVLGDFVAYPCVDPAWCERILGVMDDREEPDPQPVERLVTLPSRGVFAEAKLGHCNASEEIDNTRFWDWQQSPIPHHAPEIAPIQAVTPQPQAPTGLQPTQFPASLLNIVNPPNAPDPTGMAAILTALTTANIFRDMSGRAELADLLKKLSDNSVAIAQVAQKAATAPPGGCTGGAAPHPRRAAAYRRAKDSGTT
ncbi:MAG TPA: hypothetical protein VGA87_00930, partial [Pyrinomonadaceae bacterium]